MKLTVKEKAVIIQEIRKSMKADLLQKEDAVEILDILEKAARRRQEEMERQYPWLKVSDIVQ